MLAKTGIALVVLVGMGAVANAALAEESGLQGCTHMRKQALQALDANQQSPNFDSARASERAGQEYCQTGIYDLGIKRFARALQLLGADKSSGAPVLPHVGG